MDPLQQALASKDEAGFQAELERRISALKADKNPSDVSAHNSEVTTLLTALRQGKTMLPAFSFKRYMEDVESSRISRGPASFSFKAPMKRASQIEKKEETTATPEQKIDWTIHDLKDERIEHICDGKLISINNLTNCVLFVPNVAPAISLNNLHHCVVIVNEITGSARITECHNCRFAFSVKQLRIHDTTDTDFYIAVVGDPIIEKCTRLRFAPLRPNAGPWDNVKDFDCPTSAEASPNWCAIPEEERQLPQFEK